MCKVSDTNPTGNGVKATDLPTPAKLPVIIAGAGPCGLVTALTLQQHGVPFIIYERASRDKLCSNAGSGFDMAPTAVDILEKKLKIDMNKAMRPYDYMYMADMKGRTLNTYSLIDLPDYVRGDFGFANRADLQNALLDSLMENIKNSVNEQEKILKCGITVTGYTNYDDHVDITLSDGSIAKGISLLACDGIHSATRKHMHRNVNDDLHYCGQECWWGKTTIVPGSELDIELRRTMEANIPGDKKSASSAISSCAIAMAGSHKRPGTFFSCPVAEDTHAWVYCVKASGDGKKQQNAPKQGKANKSNDLTRRGGSILNEAEKQRELLEPMSDHCKLIKLIVQGTPAADITRAGFYDRENLHLPYTDGRVALLGDAAHPQSPMMGQGANMAIVDGHVLGTRLASSMANDRSYESSLDDDGVREALAAFDCTIRRKGVNKVIGEARFYGNLAVSNNRFTCWFFKSILKYTPPATIMKELEKGDKSNKKFVKSMELEI